jgi:hypothetical protein
VPDHPDSQAQLIDSIEGRVGKNRAIWACGAFFSKFLGGYTHRVAISNERLLGLTGQQGRCQWNDYRHQHKQNSRVMSVTAEEFIHRFLLDTLPVGFQRIRHFCYRTEKLALCQRLLTAPGW